MVESKESVDRSVYAQMHIQAIVKKLTDTKRLSRECRRAGVAPESVRRWANDGISSLTDKLEAFMKVAGYVPESVFESKLRKSEAPTAETRSESSRAKEVASKIIDASRLNRINDEDLDILNSMIDRLSRSKPLS
jgi:hypothetical protein